MGQDVIVKVAEIVGETGLRSAGGPEAHDH
jgi:hypothetical protein